ncbi:MAG: hypothetical protein LBM76_01785 [Mycoplasmataceae bacterium]|nr:hypothetical protein [Mycoplasmataceae bacterium]
MFRIKEEISEIFMITETNKFKYLSSLAKNNKKINEILSSLVGYKTELIEAIKIIKLKIFKATELNANYLYFPTRKIIVDIQNDLKKCEQLSDKIKKISEVSSQYTKNISNLIVDYRYITASLITFYDYNLALEYRNEFFREMLENVQEKLIESNNFISNVNDEKLFPSLLALNNSIDTFYKNINDYYLTSKIHVHLRALKARIETELKPAIKNLSSIDQTFVQQATNKSGIHLDQIKTALMNRDVVAAKSLSIVACRDLETSVWKIETGDKTNLLVQRSIKWVNDQILALKKINKATSESLFKIRNNLGGKDYKLETEIGNIALKINDLSLSYASLTDLYSGYDAVERHKIIHRIDETVAQIYDLKDRVANLAKAISEAYGESIVIFDKLSNLKLFFAQLLGHKLSSGNTPIENLEIYKRNLSTIDTLYEKLSADYSGNKEVVENEIEHLQEEVALIVQTYALDKTLKVYAERLIFFTNKYRNEAAEIKQFLNLAEAFYKKGEYSNTVNLLIDTLSLIKESAEGSKIAFN